MSYQDIADMAEDWGLRMRLIACAAQEHPDNPVVFVEDQIWRICGQPGWGDAWQYARLTHEGVEGYEIGKDDTVLTDAMILSGMQFVVNTVKERTDAAAATAVAAQAEQADLEAARHLATFAAQRDLEIAKPIYPVDNPPPEAVQLPVIPDDPHPADPNAPPPATGAFEEPDHTPPPEEPPPVPTQLPAEEPTP